MLLPNGSANYGLIIAGASTRKSVDAKYNHVLRGRIDYQDALGNGYWTLTCWYYDPIVQGLTPCWTGNKVGNKGKVK